MQKCNRQNDQRPCEKSWLAQIDQPEQAAGDQPLPKLPLPERHHLDTNVARQQKREHDFLVDKCHPPDGKRIDRPEPCSNQRPCPAATAGNRQREPPNQPACHGIQQSLQEFDCRWRPRHSHQHRINRPPGYVRIMPLANRFRNQPISIAVLTQIPTLLQIGETDENKGQPEKKRSNQTN